MKTIIFTLIVVLSLSFYSRAEYVQTCIVQYATSDYEWSENYTVVVYFDSGIELNKKTNTFNYDSYSTYATIFWGEDKASVMKISSYLTCGTEIKWDCIANQYGYINGEDQEGRKWRICVRNYCY